MFDPTLLRHHICAFSFVLSLLSPLASHAQDSLIIEHGPRSSMQVALTFDACPTSLQEDFDERVIDVLLKGKVPATLFMSGRWVEKNAEKVKLLAMQPQFEIANHAFWHLHLLEKDDDRIVRELQRTQAVISKTTGKTPKYFRPPFGEVNERLARLARQEGLVTIQYDIASGDPDAGLSPQKIERAVLHDAKGGSIIVFHMNRNGVHTAEMLPVIIKGLREKGFELVTVGEMMQERNKELRTTKTRGSGEEHGIHRDQGRAGP